MALELPLNPSARIASKSQCPEATPLAVGLQKTEWPLASALDSPLPSSAPAPKAQQEQALQVANPMKCPRMPELLHATTSIENSEDIPTQLPNFPQYVRVDPETPALRVVVSDCRTNL